MAESPSNADIIKEIRTKFVGKWKMVESNNFEAFLKAMDAPFLARKMAGTMKPDCEISIIDDQVRIYMSTMVTSQDFLFRFGETFDQETERGKAKLHPTFVDGKIVFDVDPFDSKHKKNKVIREIKDGKLILTLEAGNTVATRIFERA
ncbi:fatty acid-binding protein, adipocyte-like [Haliotis rubra]|uniref:fatty acid-binding protein, adipocyte-like n=1 Tax=Haliotis rubra TaxID=36100 RepID=UPI001EE5FE24|nr:fatty acid-binding protein, adipocyte-like [Haliotis rubra]